MNGIKNLFKTMFAFFREDNGRPSMMRLLAFLGAVNGTSIIVAGIYGFLTNMPDAISMVITGAGIFTGSELLKAGQKAFENKDTTEEAPQGN